MLFGRGCELDEKQQNLEVELDVGPQRPCVCVSAKAIADLPYPVSSLRLHSINSA